MQWEKICATDKINVQNIKTALTQNLKKTNKNWTEDLNRHFSPKRRHKMANRHEKMLSIANFYINTNKSHKSYHYTSQKGITKSTISVLMIGQAHIFYFLLVQ